MARICEIYFNIQMKPWDVDNLPNFWMSDVPLLEVLRLASIPITYKELNWNLNPDPFAYIPHAFCTAPTLCEWGSHTGAC